ncbi:MAG: amino acid-binding protein [Thermoproteota archaeon]|nr:amino acid-binding protein [Candidatus Brockarchaeota archaeon]MBO3768482.1 amino acid-binding protein [Candidatus Brockarchaeota archaeon]MBO3801844.1 amino acid-binding protein [Candidatus Brockarchaeota archaeon]
MWSLIKDKFKGNEAKEKVVKFFIEYGISIKEDGKLYFGPVKLTFSNVSSAINVDRRVVKETALQILKDEQLRPIFRLLKPAGPSLVDVANVLGLSVLEIRADPHKPGIVSGVTSILSEKGIAIRQIIAEDPELFPDPKLYVITESKIPGDVIERALQVPHVREVSVKRGSTRSI